MFGMDVCFSFDVGRSMFDVHFFSVNLPQSPGAIITQRLLLEKVIFIRIIYV
jgi:hypothetical protein